ncbi:MAG: glycosyl hydrolase family 28-related protein [Leptolyngbyaceae cyanobacterium MO_188.B28]|nr:glycosyl hydrolase family 28-related protein [Leptolyngbyaceae cyanobacterium MO_188.B28]
MRKQPNLVRPSFPFRIRIRYFREILLALFTVFCVLSATGLSQLTRQENIIFPTGANVVNVQSAPYNAKGDGVTDDTYAIQTAIENNRGKLIYFPNGVYRVSDTLRCQSLNGKQKRFFLQGQSQSGVVIKLDSGIAAFEEGDQEAAKSVVTFWEGDVKDATAFRNTIRNMTIDIGANNPGVIGLRFRANNYGAVENVTIRSSDQNRRGKYGLDLSMGLNGPLLVKNLSVKGFDYGVYYTGALHSATIDGLTLEDQRVYGVYNKRQVLSIHKLVSRNRVPAIKNDSGGGNAHGLVTLVDAVLKEGDSSNSAIDNTHNGGLYVRNLTTTGYRAAIESQVDGKTVQKLSPVDEFVSHGVISLFPGPGAALKLPIEETPEIGWDSPADWATVNGSADDDTSAIQAAIDSGKPTVYFPKDDYTVSRTIELKGNVRRIIGIGGAKIKTQGSMRNSNQAIFRIMDGAFPVVTIEGLESDQGSAFGFEHASKRTLVLRHLGIGGYRNPAGDNKLFIEDVTGWRWCFKNQQVWARQLNTEASSESGRHNIDNDGADVWILGLKTERDVPVITTRNGGRTELLGGFLYGNRPIPNNTVGFLNQESSQSLVWAGFNSAYKPYVREIQNGVTKDLDLDALFPIKYGKMSPLFVGD